MERRIKAIQPHCPSSTSSSGLATQFAHFLQDGPNSYKEAILKDEEKLRSSWKQVTTKNGDKAYVVPAPGDGNCLPTACLRGFIAGGRPLKPAVEGKGIEEWRKLVGDVILSHTWPHSMIANPQTIEQCVEETKKKGGWCGEVAMSAFAHLTDTCIRLWRYPLDDRDGKIIEPLMQGGINETEKGAVPKQIIHLIQTRLAKVGQPEFCSHWESLIMIPPSAAMVGIQYGPIDSTNPFNSTLLECYEWIENHDVQPIHRIKIGDTLLFKGRGKKPNYERVVCQLSRLRRKIEGPLGALQIGHITLDGAAMTVGIPNVVKHAEKQLNEADVKLIISRYRSALKPISIPSSDDNNDNAPINESSLLSSSSSSSSSKESGTPTKLTDTVKGRKRKPVVPFQPAVAPSPTKQPKTKAQSKKKSTKSRAKKQKKLEEEELEEEEDNDDEQLTVTKVAKTRRTVNKKITTSTNSNNSSPSSPSSSSSFSSSSSSTHNNSTSIQSNEVAMLQNQFTELKQLVVSLVNQQNSNTPPPSHAHHPAHQHLHQPSAAIPRNINSGILSSLDNSNNNTKDSPAVHVIHPRLIVIEYPNSV